MSLGDRPTIARIGGIDPQESVETVEYHPDTIGVYPDITKRDLRLAVDLGRDVIYHAESYARAVDALNAHLLESDIPLPLIVGGQVLTDDGDGGFRIGPAKNRDGGL